MLNHCTDAVRRIVSFATSLYKHNILRAIKKRDFGKTLNWPTLRLVYRLYKDIPLLHEPINHKNPPKTTRNADICARHNAGETLQEIAAVYDISLQRVHEITYD